MKTEYYLMPKWCCQPWALARRQVAEMNRLKGLLDEQTTRAEKAEADLAHTRETVLGEIRPLFEAEVLESASVAFYRLLNGYRNEKARAEEAEALAEANREKIVGLLGEVRELTNKLRAKAKPAKKKGGRK